MKTAACLLVVLLSVQAHAQSGLRVLVGGLELTHQYGVLFGLPLGDGPLSLEGQVGPGGAGGSVNVAWPIGPHDTRDQGLSWFVSAGAGPYFQSSSPGTPVGGVFTMIGGLRVVTGGGEWLRFARDGGLTLEAGIGFFQNIARGSPVSARRGTAGRLAMGWEF